MNTDSRDTEEIKIEGNHYIAIPQETTTLRTLGDNIDQYFPTIPQELRYERVTVRGPFGSEPEGYLIVGLRQPANFVGAECPLPAYRCAAQLFEAAAGRDLNKVKFVVPYGRPNDLTLYMS